MALNITDESDFWDVDEALYRHERGFYAACTTGHGLPYSHYAPGGEWDYERKRLQKLWYAKCPYKRNEPPAPPPSLFGRFIEWLAS